MLPLAIARCILLLVGSEGVVSLVVRALCTAWATYSASRWMATKDLARKQALLVVRAAAIL